MNSMPISPSSAAGVDGGAVATGTPMKNATAAAAVAEMARHLTVDTDDAFAGLLELAADDKRQNLLNLVNLNMIMDVMILGCAYAHI